MKVALTHLKKGQVLSQKQQDGFDANKSSLTLAFGAKEELQSSNIYEFLKEKYPISEIVIASTSGEIYDDAVYDDSITISSLQFEKSNVKTYEVSTYDFKNSFDAGVSLAQKINAIELAYILIISDGSLVNGSELVRGLSSLINSSIPITGGLAGDADKFTNTLVGLNGAPVNGKIVAIAFYGNDLKIAHGTMGGWDMFGPERKVTKSNANELFEIENKNALDIYKNYLGEYANQLPSSALLFPLSLKLEGNEYPIVRTILKIDEEKKSMIFAGDIPENSTVRFMKANFDRLVDAATSAANQSLEKFNTQPQFALLISCVGRKLILGKRVDEEVEAVNETFNSKTFISGFYSYGEISPFMQNAKCELHNQTMTITTFDEV